MTVVVVGGGGANVGVVAAVDDGVELTLRSSSSLKIWKKDGNVLGDGAVDLILFDLIYF